ncbi:aldolase [Bacillus canaveralius]|uniref:Aldolase n=1 Tax=Bacillus canaveralius TaxID=1403243 RepID=A0A2N5GK08_9BACI|nr:MULTISPECIES: bifunctional 4-hydroxy-2-oxoglutarate aldolase/2-dehydro-3-deoxy-phosphogluconate aldolase [Bacillus]PLR81646.1 aldolase [Bacillus canaveralius]PLR87712.1 aldolase [Bacillus sp. V33-4]PLR89890.1 aldolase [Bacillus canaveralius]
MIVDKGTIVAIIRGVDPSNVIDVQEALIEGGINWVEVSLSEEEKGLECIRILNKRFGQKINLGVGTVTNIDQAKKAIEAGAKYVITPGWDKELIKQLLQLNINVFPGVFTPGEVMQTINQNIKVQKLFPAGNLGSDYVKNLKGPFPNLHLMAVGGVSLDNIMEFYQAGCSSFGIGSDLVPWGATKKDKEKIRAKAYEYVSVLKNEG